MTLMSRLFVFEKDDSHTENMPLATLVAICGSGVGLLIVLIIGTITILAMKRKSRGRKFSNLLH